MGSKGKSTVINNISELNLEIDYDKLAEAIVKAQEEAANKEEKSEKVGFFRAIGRILKGEKSKDGRFLSAPFALLTSLLYRCIFIFGLVSLVLFDIAAVITFLKSEWRGWAIAVYAILVILVLAVTFAVLLYLVVLWGAANDVEDEKDKNYVVSVFSGLVSVAALIVAIIALFKGIG